MSHADEATSRPDEAWAESLRQVFRDIVQQLPDHTTLGEIVGAARQTPHIAQALEVFSVGELIDIARNRPRPKAERSRRKGSAQPEADTSGPQVIRRRADAPDGELRVLRCLTQHGPVRESEIATLTQLTSDQARLVLRGLRSKGMVHFEGSGPKRRLRITRHGSNTLRRMERASA